MNEKWRSIVMNEKWREVDRSWSLGFLTFSVSIMLFQRCCAVLVYVLVLHLLCFCVALVVLLSRGGGYSRNVRNNVSTNIGAEKIILGNSRNKVSFKIGH
jgi:hypothetical protein